MKKKHEFIYVLKDKARNDKNKSIKSRMSAKEAFLQTEKEFRRLNSIVNKNKVSDITIGNNVFKNYAGKLRIQK